MIVDASVVVAGVLADHRHGEWALEVLLHGGLAAPHLMPVEVAHKLRRDSIRGSVRARDADVAMADLVRLPIDLHPFEPVAERVWGLRGSVSAYDAWYVALAEALDVPLATLDARLARAPGPRCAFLVPDAGGAS